MHDTALAFGRAFFDTYLHAAHLPGMPARILDVGSQDINGSLRDCAPAGAVYTGVDMAAGRGVDIVLDDPHSLPFAAASFDAVVSTSCFEHDPMFWVTFLEMLRVTRRGGHVYVNASANGWYHCHPQDNWRFYPDAGLALEGWARRQGHAASLLESFTGRRRGDVWNDTVMVFRCGEATPGPRISDRFADVMNLRLAGSGAVAAPAKASEDQQIIATLRRELAARERELAEWRSLAGAYEAVLAG